MPGRAEEVRVDLQHLLDHPVHQVAHLGRRVELVGQDVVAQQGQPVDGVVEVRWRRQREHVASHLLGPPLHGRAQLLSGLGAARPGSCREDLRVAGSDVRDQQLGQAAVARQGPIDGTPVDLEQRLGQVGRDHRLA